MRSHPYTPPPPLPPALNDLADELSSILPNQDARARRRCSLPDIPLSNLDPETSLLLSPAARQRHHHHHVRVQGRLALVRSVSAVRTRSSITGNTSPAGSTPPVPPVPRYESAVGGSVMSGRKRGSRGRRRRKGSLADEFGDGGTESESDDDGERQRETVIRDTQLRGYGIGGAGNIRTRYLFSAKRYSMLTVGGKKQEGQSTWCTSRPQTGWIPYCSCRASLHRPRLR